MEILKSTLGLLKAAGSHLYASAAASLTKAATVVQGWAQRACRASYAAYVILLSLAFVCVVLNDFLQHLGAFLSDLWSAVQDLPLNLSRFGWAANTASLL